MFKIRPIFSCFLLCIFLLSNTVFAQGLNEATKAASEFQVWLYSFLGIVSIVYMIYQVILALAEKQQWSDVLFALFKVAVAGGSIVGGTWAWSIWGS